MSRDVDGIIQQKYAENGDVGLDGLDLEELWTLTYSTPGGLFPSRLQFNQLFRYLSALGVEINQKGPYLEYSDIIDYSIGAIILGSDGILYMAFVANGPDSSIVDPVGDATGTWIIDITKLTQFDCDLSAAVAALGAVTETSLFNNCKPADLTGNLSIPDNINLDVLAGKEIDGPHTLTLDRPEQIQAGDYPVISSSGLTLNITKPGIINLRHYGIVPDSEAAAISNTTIMNDLLANLPAGCQFDLKPLKYWWSDTLETLKAFGFMGSGGDSNVQYGNSAWAIFKWTAGLVDTPGLFFSGDDSIPNIFNVELDMRNQTGTSKTLATGIDVRSKQSYFERVLIRGSVGHQFYNPSGNGFKSFKCSALGNRVDIRDAFDGSSTPTVPVYDNTWNPEALHGDGFFVGSDAWVSHCKSSFNYNGINAFAGHPQIGFCRCDLNTHDGVFKGSVGGDGIIVNNVCEKNGRGGIRLAETGNTVQDNVMYDNGQYGNTTAINPTAINPYDAKEKSGIYVAQNLDLLTGPRNLIDGNTSNNLNVSDAKLYDATQFGLYVENDTRVKLGVNSFVNSAISNIRLEANVSTSDDNYTVLSNNLMGFNFSAAAIVAGTGPTLAFATYLGAGSRKHTLPYRGFIAAIAVNTEDAVTAGDIDVQVRLNGGTLVNGPILDTAKPLANSKRLTGASATTIFAPNDILDCLVTASGGLLPSATIDLNITVFVAFE